ncbi:MAG: type II secretion system protein GspM [Pseudomonadota bacterium]
MKQWYASLLPREQRIIAIGAVIVVLTLAYMFVWEPLVDGHRMASEDVERKTLLLEQGRRAAAQTPIFEGLDDGVVRTPTQSLTLLVATSVNANGLGNAYRSSSPSPNGIRVSLENASFDAMITWLAQLDNDNRVVVTAGNISDRPQSGRVDASIVLERL